MSTEPLRLAYVGLPLGALLLERDGHDFVWVGLSRRDSLGTRRAQRVFGDRVAVTPKLDGPTLRRVREQGANYLVSWFWTKRVPPAWLKSFGGQTLGVHPSLLPRHRGPDPIFWAIDAGDAVTGVSAHRLEVEYDVGDVLAQRTVPIDDDVNGWKLAKRLDRPSLAVLRDLLGRVRSGDALQALPQDENLATEAPALEDDDLSIVWSWDASRISRRIRAASPWPGAWTEVGETLVTLVRASVRDAAPAALSPGEAWVDGDRAFVRCGLGALELDVVRLEDDRVLRGPQVARFVEAAQGI